MRSAWSEFIVPDVSATFEIDTPHTHPYTCDASLARDPYCSFGTLAEKPVKCVARGGRSGDDVEYTARDP